MGDLAHTPGTTRVRNSRKRLWPRLNYADDNSFDSKESLGVGPEGRFVTLMIVIIRGFSRIDREILTKNRAPTTERRRGLLFPGKPPVFSHG